MVALYIGGLYAASNLCYNRMARTHSLSDVPSRALQSRSRLSEVKLGLSGGRRLDSYCPHLYLNKMVVGEMGIEPTRVFTVETRHPTRPQIGRVFRFRHSPTKHLGGTEVGSSSRPQCRLSVWRNLERLTASDSIWAVWQHELERTVREKHAFASMFSPTPPAPLFRRLWRRVRWYCWDGWRTPWSNRDDD